VATEEESLGRLYRGRVDPIRYAWEHCNRGVSLPGALVRSTGPAPTVGLSASTSVAQAAAAAATIRAALHSLIIRGRPAPAKD